MAAASRWKLCILAGDTCGQIRRAYCPTPITLCTLFAMSTNGSWKAIDGRCFAGIKGSKAVHSIVNTRSSFRDMGSTDVQAARMEARKSSFNQEIKCKENDLRIVIVVFVSTYRNLFQEESS